jgi:hypothetical protein
MFYGAFDQDTCISELRPAVGETIVCGAFRETKPLRVFDFTVLNEVYSELSMFDPDYPEKLSQLSFLRSFESIISKAFLPHDTTLEYLPLQAMTEYLSRFVDGGVDALIYPSAQREGVKQNIVVFDGLIRTKETEEFLVFETSSKPLLVFIEESMTVHKIKSVEYRQTDESLKDYIMGLEFELFDR